MKLYIKILLLCLGLAGINAKQSRAQLSDDNSKKKNIKIKSEKTVSLICMFNFGVLQPTNSFELIYNEPHYNIYFKVTPKLGYSKNIAIGFSSKIFKGIELENLIGFGNTSLTYNKIGYSILTGWVNKPIIFIGEQNEKQVGIFFASVNGITLSNPKRKGNKFYFSNYLFTSIVFKEITKSNGFDQYTNSMFSSKKSASRFGNYYFHTSHILSHGFNIKNKLLKIGLGLSYYPFDNNLSRYSNDIYAIIPYPFVYKRINSVINTTINF